MLKATPTKAASNRRRELLGAVSMVMDAGVATVCQGELLAPATQMRFQCKQTRNETTGEEWAHCARLA
jgi:hypothetical protein